MDLKNPLPDGGLAVERRPILVEQMDTIRNAHTEQREIIRQIDEYLDKITGPRTENEAQERKEQVENCLVAMLENEKQRASEISVKLYSISKRLRDLVG